MIKSKSRYLSIFLTVILMPLFTEAQLKIGPVNQVSVGQNNQIPAGPSGGPVNSPNSLHLAFNSNASNLVSGDGNSATDVFLKDAAGTVSRLSVSTSDIEGDQLSTNPAISAVTPDGFFAVAFESDATNLSTFTDSLDNRDIYARLPTINLTLPLSVAAPSAAGSPPVFGNGDSFAPSVTVLPAPNRVLVTFSSDASNLVTGDGNGFRDIYLATFTAPSSNSGDFTNLVTVTRVSTAALSGTEPNGDSDTPVISGDGRFVVFTSRATNLINGTPTTGAQIFLKDLSTGATTLVSRTAFGGFGELDSDNPSISYSGRFIAYTTLSQGIVSHAIPGKKSAVLFDTVSGIPTRINTSTAGEASNGNAENAVISANGRLVSFSDDATNLDPAGNSGADAFIKDLSTGALGRVSITSTGEAPNGESDNTFTSTETYNSVKSVSSYRSFATNLTGGGVSSGVGDIFTTPAELNLENFTRSTRLEVPADVTTKSKQSKIVMQKFSGIDLSRSSTRAARLRAAPKQRIMYDVRVEGEGARRRDRFQTLSRRNTVTQRKLKPGTYTSRYRVIVQKGSKTKSKTPFSPRQRFTIS